MRPLHEIVESIKAVQAEGDDNLCMCGDDIRSHSPWALGHTPVSQRSYTLRGLQVELKLAIPEGYRLLENSDHAQRSWPGDATHENGQYFNECKHCLRMFTGHKRRIACRVCDGGK